jgi:hypothetical protein
MEDNSLREFVERLLWRDRGSPSPRVELLLGRAPDDLPIALPLQSGWRVVGSTSTGEASQLQQWDIVLDASGTLSSISDHFQNAWKEQGWQVGEWDLFGSSVDEAGFLPNPASPGMKEAMFEMVKARANRPEAPTQLMLCRDSVRLRVMLSGRQLDGNVNDLHINVHGHPSLTPCGEDNIWPMSPIQDLIPKLYPPLEVTMSGGGLSAGTHHWDREATAVTNMTSQALEAHYENQLKELGWTKLEGEAVPSMAWSKWSIPYKDKAQGYLSVVQDPHEHSRKLSMHLEIEPPRSSLPPGVDISQFRWLVGRELPPDEPASQPDDRQDTKDEGS